MIKKITFFFGLLIINAFVAKAQSSNLYFPPKTGTVWQTTAPATLGFCPERIDSLYHFLEIHNTKSFILLKDGKIVLEKYFGTFVQDSIWYWASAGKSLTSFMVGQAQEEGLLNIENPISDYLGVGWTSCPPAKEALIKVRNQLDMTTGLNDNIPATPNVPDPDNCTTPACLTYMADAGTRWAYHNAPYRLIHNVLEAASGKTLQQFTKSHVLDRTGMKGIWLDHIMYSRARDMARYGLLILAGGRWDTDTLLHDQTFFYNMIHPSQGLNKSYGYLWWLNGQESFMLPSIQFVFNYGLVTNAPPDMFAALGKNDQKIHVVPSKGWVVVRMGNDGGFNGPGGSQVPIVFDAAMWDYLNALECTPTAVLTPIDARLRVWPNPTVTGWNVEAVMPIDQVALYTLTGRLVIDYQGDGGFKAFVPAEGLGTGAYLLKVVSGDKALWERVVK